MNWEDAKAKVTESETLPVKKTRVGDVWSVEHVPNDSIRRRDQAKSGLAELVVDLPRMFG